MNSNRLSNQPPKQKPFIQRVGIPTAIILVSLVVALILFLSATKPHKKPTVKKVPLVEVVTVKASDVTFQISTQGSVSPRTETILISEVSGQVKKVSPKFVVGGFFKKGEQLLEIDPINYEVALLQAQARLDSAKARWVEEKARSQQAKKEWSLTGRSLKNAPILALRKPQLQLAKADVKAAKADVKGAEIKLQRTKIIAPYDAMIKKKLVDIGQYVTMGSQLAVSFAVDYAEIRLPIKEVDLPYIAVPKMNQLVSQENKAKPLGSEVILSFKQNSEIKQWKTHITRSEGVVDQSSRVNYLIAQIDDPYGVLATDLNHPVLAVGSFVRADIMGTQINNIMVVPREALRGADSLYLIDQNNKLKVVKVRIIRSDNENIYIVSGLQQNSKVVLTKLPIVVAGMSLRTEEQQTQDSSADGVNSKGDEG
ncbi:MAG: efflux RND transporter periplasmic adaptor subunit [Enterobacterales bacterium]|nr:efflux RND transporter periplasmic adaptor subunit [Enterobacterales bacterium]